MRPGNASEQSPLEPAVLDIRLKLKPRDRVGHSGEDLRGDGFQLAGYCGQDVIYEPDLLPFERPILSMIDEINGCLDRIPPLLMRVDVNKRAELRGTWGDPHRRAIQAADDIDSARRCLQTHFVVAVGFSLSHMNGSEAVLLKQERELLANDVFEPFVACGFSAVGP